VRVLSSDSESLMQAATVAKCSRVASIELMRVHAAILRLAGTSRWRSWSRP
jgi:hypothetical protein